MIRKAFADARRDQAHKFAQKRLQRCLKRTPDAPVLHTTVTLRQDVDALVNDGWEIVSTHNRAPVRGTSLFTETVLRRPNPRLDDAA